MERYAIFFDIDGTIVPEGTAEIPETTREAIRLAQKNGHYTFINTGRTYPAVDSFVKELNFDGYICGCGTNIYFQGEELMSKQLGNKLSAEIARDLEKYHIDGILEGVHNIYYRKKPFHPDVLGIQKGRKERGLVLKEDRFWDDADICYDKMALWLTEDSDFNKFRRKYETQFEMIQRADDFFELVPKGYSKASGMEYIEKHLGIAHEHTIAIGDSTNDLPMLSYAAISIAMGNSNPAIFNQVSYITADIYEDGIYKALEHYNIIK